MESNAVFAQSGPQNVDLRKARRESGVILLILSFAAAFMVVDIFSDLGDGAAWGHLLIESLVAILSWFGVILLWKRTALLKNEVVAQRELARRAEIGRLEALDEALKWKSEAASAIRGLCDAIDAQMVRWQLTHAEKEVALLLLKGLSLKEIAQVRGVSEKTARAQSFSIYSKSGLSGRAELSAFFLEDLMLPSLNFPSSLSKEKTRMADMP